MGLPVTLVFPPSADPSLPHGALPLLGAVLRRAGHDEVELRDLNLEVFDQLLRPEPLARAAEGRHRDVAIDVVTNITEARRILRDPVDFYDPAKLLYAKRIFHLAGDLITAGQPESSFGKYSYSSASYDSYEEVAHAVDTETGPLGAWYRDVAVPSLLARKPRVIGLSVPYFSQLVPAFLLAEEIRRQDPGVHITCGGPVITWGREVLTADPRFGRWLDSFFVGEADETFLEFVDALAEDRDLGKVRNVVRYVGGEVREQLDPTYQLHLDWLPAPDYTMLPLGDYFAPKRVICMMPTRGCYFNRCAFCNYAFIKLAPYRMRSPKLIAEDVAAVVQATGEDVFSFEADVMLPMHLRSLSEALLERQVDISWHGVARFEKGFTPEVFATMREAGCVRLYMGLESANERVLKAMDKGTTPQRMAEILAMCHTAGISVEAGVFSDFPSETAAEAEDTYRFVHEHRHVIGRADAGTFRLLKGAPIADEPELYGITVRDEPSQRWYHLDYEERTGVSTGLAERIQRLYPEVALVDVPEDILYIAEFGPNEFRRFFDGQSPCGETEIPHDATVSLAEGVELHRVLVANSGAVHFDTGSSDTGSEEGHAGFERSHLAITIAVDRKGSRVHPLGEDEEELLRRLAEGDTCVDELASTVDKLVARGLVAVRSVGDA
ncbi:B12-binding domain-containing radical SAM protein [Allokutzneria oryzae]|uniref:B12-binding domain-containing radical SAM protein n=1 Tax=Allokutzneria oryzae TaxID=1378989 RepID=A0ABV5ZXK3_9PSEU